MLDGAGYHRKKEVVDKAEELGIVLHYLPSYSPNLNPIYPNHFKMQVPVGVQNALDKALIAENGISFSKLITQHKAFITQPWSL